MDFSKEIIAEYVLTKYYLLGQSEELSTKLQKENSKILVNHSKVLLLRHELEELKADIDSMRLDSSRTIYNVMAKYGLKYKFDIDALFN